ncbi:glycerophosphodiester phosphodiesterase [Actinomyces qiguomingii]|uniref:glycerophosphodiester phosphodiesterase n=1 Tax=Actinomyces qiguomingii TaxID=2057800 RepID=UPI000CA0531C|nr:glycerophosphodiester phosphodiesterase family protein [Actinomyces qiguomingii]
MIEVPGSAGPRALTDPPRRAPRLEQAPLISSINLTVRGAEDHSVASTPTALTQPAEVDVDTLLDADGWIIAHRGGSADWPEMSLRAYSESVARNVPALEFSFNLTADGVAVGVHDKDLQAVDGQAPDTRVSQMTWDQARAYTTRGEPLIRLTDLQAAYGEDHVLFIDPKHSGAAHETYLPWLDPGHTILKFYGDATWLAEIWRAAGFRTWGYAYEEDIISGKAADWAPYWDLFGVPWNASATTWRTAADYGLPLIGHICDGQQAVDICFERGAIGAMCAKVDGIAWS